MRSLIVYLGLVMLVLILATPVLAKSNKVTICHATSSETNPYVRIVVSENAIFGHFENPGTPLAGHEEDILLEGRQECPTLEPSASPSEVGSSSPSVSPSVEPTPPVEGSTLPDASILPTPTPDVELPNTAVMGN